MKKLFLFCLLSFLLFPLLTLAQNEPTTTETTGRIESIIEQQLEPASEAFQVVEVRIISEGDFDNRLFTVDSRGDYLTGLRHQYTAGQKVKVSILSSPDGNNIVFITDVVRLEPLMWLVILFVVVTLLVGLIRGLSSLIGLMVILTVLFGFILPNLLAGRDPIIFTLIGATVIMLVSVFGTHGLRKQSVAAFLGTLGGLTITGILAAIFVPLTKLTGLASEEAALLQVETGMSLNAQGILLAAVIIGALGVLDDVAVTQSETVFELKKTDPTLKVKELASRALKIGRHHIASVTNTLVLAYAGASLPLLLLFLAVDTTTIDLVNSEFIAEEIVRTLVGTIGLICTVPLATWIAALYATRK